MGESGDRLTRAAKVLEQLTGGQTPVFSKGEICPPSIPVSRCCHFLLFIVACVTAALEVLAVHHFGAILFLLHGSPWYSF